LLAFGTGPHACPGANLARAEAAIVIATLARELPDLRLRKDDPPHLQLLSFNAPARVLIETA
jgi:cytochrome P450